MTNNRMKSFAYSMLAFALPIVVGAQTQEGGGGFDTSTAQSFFASLIGFINNILVPLIFALAFILFLFGVFKYFFASGAKADESRTEGKKFILWGVIALAVMISIWGLVNIIVRTFGFENETRPCLPTFSGPCNSNGSSPNSSSNTPTPTPLPGVTPGI